MKANKKMIFLMIAFASLIFNSCKKDDQPVVNQLSDTVKIVNNFIYQTTVDYYLWTDEIPSGIDVNDYPDPYDLFDAMYYPALDHWSFATDDYQTVLDGLNGSRKTAGYRLQLYRYITGNNVFGIVEYVYEGGPASIAGILRGDVILSINGQTLTLSNYQALLSIDVMELGFGKIVDSKIQDNGVTKTITQAEMTINPVLQYSVLEKNAKKIGYLLYDQFIENYFTDLESVMTYFKGQNIDDLVLDLRYNPGGYVSTCEGLASILAPSTAIGEVFLTQHWNANLTSYFTQHYGSQSEYFTMKFPVPNVNLNLNRLFVLTSTRTASASESLINCLKPYMEVVLIGDTTSGKYTGANFFYDDVNHSHNWGLYLVIDRIANVNGSTDFINGFAPDYHVYDNYSTPLGDETEPLLAKAISLITAIPVKSAGNKVQEFSPLAKMYDSPFEKQGMMVLNNKALKGLIKK